MLCERNYSKRLAYNYLEDISQEFYSQYGKRVKSVIRPYAFIEFENYLQKSKKGFADSRSRRNMNALNSQLQDVQRIMVQNIDDVLQRGTVLSGKYMFQLSNGVTILHEIIFESGVLKLIVCPIKIRLTHFGAHRIYNCQNPYKF